MIIIVIFTIKTYFHHYQDYVHDHDDQSRNFNVVIQKEFHKLLSSAWDSSLEMIKMDDIPPRARYIIYWY